MIDAKEHDYFDDPREGHPDVRTMLKNVSYFFLGNGLIQAAVQVSPAGEGSAMGLIFMNPEKLAPKRASLSFDETLGFSVTMIRLTVQNNVELLPREIRAEWCSALAVPAVRLHWQQSGFQVTEIFYCPNRTEAKLIRKIQLENMNPNKKKLTIHTALPHKKIENILTINSLDKKELCIEYLFDPAEKHVDLNFIDNCHHEQEIARLDEATAKINFHHEMLDRYFLAAKWQLPATISASGIVDASIWQYNREWVRDHSFMAIGLTLSGEFTMAKTLVKRLLNDFVSEDGDCFDSSAKRDPEEVELDQNGTLLYALNTYALWSDDFDLVEEYWSKIVKIAEFPLSDVFRHPQLGLFFNSREYWERHDIHGVTPGIELMYQVFPAIGLQAAAILARKLRKNDLAKKWELEAARIKRTVLTHPVFSLVDERGFIKRRDLAGRAQETIEPANRSILPEGIPLTENIIHYLNPDTSAALPIVYGFIEPDSAIAHTTLNTLEQLWNQCWKIGGYGRYHFSSEADSPGPWPFPSLFLARAYLETGDWEKVWKILKWLDTIPGATSGAWFEMYGPRISPPYAQVGITPWTWGEIIMLAVNQILGVLPEEKSIRLRPRLLSGMTEVEGKLLVRKNYLNLKYKVDQNISKPSFKTNVSILERNDREILIPYVEKDIFVEAIVP